MYHDEFANRFFSGFKEEFVKNWNSTSLLTKPLAIKYLNTFYKKWYFSAITEGAKLTPAYLYHSYYHNYQSEYAFSTLLPQKKLFKNGRLSLSFKSIEFTKDTHPVLRDLKVFLDSCVPDFELIDGYFVSDKHMETLGTCLTIDDPFYVEYLVLLSFKLNLIKPMPSLYSSKAQITDAYHELSALEKSSFFDLIVRATASIFLDKIMELPLDTKGLDLDIDFVFAILKKPLSTEQIFQEAFSSDMYKADSIFSTASEETIGSAYESFLSNAYYLGIIFDRYFATTFGYYLNMIIPTYPAFFDIARDMEFAMEIDHSNEDLSFIMFCPYTRHVLSDFGHSFFKTHQREQTPKTESILKLVETMNNPKKTHSLVEALSVNDKSLSDLINKDSLGNIYDIKIKMVDNKALWKRVEFLENMALMDVYVEVCYEFNFDINSKCTFYQDSTENPFARYEYPCKRVQDKNPENIPLCEFIFEESQTFILVLHDVASPFSDTNISLPLKNVKFELEIIKKKPKNKKLLYPNLKSESSLFKELDMDWFI